MKFLFALVFSILVFHSVSFATFIGKPAKVGNGGTGLDSPGTNGNVLTSTGSAWTSAAPGALVGDAVSVKLSSYTLAASDKVVVYAGLNSGTLSLPSCVSTGQKVFAVILDSTTASVTVQSLGLDYLNVGLQDLILTDNGAAVQLACAGGTTYYVY